jgi:hypothetical protein
MIMERIRLLKLDKYFEFAMRGSGIDLGVDKKRIALIPYVKVLERAITICYERELKMVKKSIIAIALMSMLATVSFGADLEGGDFYSSPGQVKIDGLWPATITIDYTPIELCRIPIWIEVGMFIEIENCSNKKIVLKQRECPGGQSFPCYKGCTGLTIRANFDATLSLKLYKSGDIIKNSWGQDRWKAYFTVDDGATQSSTWNIVGDGNPNNVDLCVEAWDANIYDASPNTQEAVGQVAILALPQGTPDFCDYCD